MAVICVNLAWILGILLTSSFFHLLYDPFDDLYVPCRELALKFEKGDILHITDRSDDNWWQAFRDGETGITLAGLIPSSTFERTRQNLLQRRIKMTNEEQK